MPILYKAWLLLTVALSGVNAAQKETPKESHAIYSMCDFKATCLEEDYRKCLDYHTFRESLLAKKRSLAKQRDDLNAQIKKFDQTIQVIENQAAQANQTGLIPCKK